VGGTTRVGGVGVAWVGHPSASGPVARESCVGNPGSIAWGYSHAAPPPGSPPTESRVGRVLGSIPRVPSLTIDGGRVARNAHSRATTADPSPERETSVVDDDEKLSRRRRREDRQARPRRSAGLGLEPLNIVTSDRVTSDRTTSATAPLHSRPWPSLAPCEPGEARLELPPAGSRAESGIAPPSQAPTGDLPPGPRAGGPIPWVPALCSCAGAPLALREPGGARLELPPAGSRAGGGTDTRPHVVMSVSCPTPKWVPAPDRAASGCVLPEGAPAGGRVPVGSRPGGKGWNTVRCPRAPASVVPALVWRSSTDDPPPGGEDRFRSTPSTSTPRWSHSPPHRPSTRPDSAKFGVAGRRPQR